MIKENLAVNSNAIRTPAVKHVRRNNGTGVVFAIRPEGLSTSDLGMAMYTPQFQKDRADSSLKCNTCNPLAVYRELLLNSSQHSTLVH